MSGEGLDNWPIISSPLLPTNLHYRWSQLQLYPWIIVEKASSCQQLNPTQSMYMRGIQFCVSLLQELVLKCKFTEPVKEWRGQIEWKKRSATISEYDTEYLWNRCWPLRVIDVVIHLRAASSLNEVDSSSNYFVSRWSCRCCCWWLGWHYSARGWYQCITTAPIRRGVNHTWMILTINLLFFSDMATIPVPMGQMGVAGGVF